MAIDINPSQALNLGGQPGAYSDTFSALNMFVGADAWIYFDATGKEIRGGVPSDGKGWPTLFPVIDGVSQTVVANVFYTKIMPPGEYIVEWQGADSLITYSNYEVIGPNKIKIKYEGPNADGADSGVSLLIEPSSTTDRTIDVSNIKFYKAEYADLVAMGESFDPKWFQAIDDFRILRTHDWQGTNFSKVTGPTENDFNSDQAFWIKDGRGMPYDKIVEIANDTRSDLWINIPHMATDAYIRQVAEYVKANLDPDLRVYVEYTNEYWTTIFDQHPYLTQKGAELFPGDPYARGQAYAARFSEMTAIFKDVFGAQDARLYPTLTLNHGMFATGEAQAVLNAPAWVAKGGTSPLDAGLKHLATDGYFDWYTPDPNMNARIAAWMAQPDGGFGAARDFLINRITTELVPAWQLGRQLANQLGLEFGIYEGGALLINGVSFADGDPMITDFNKRFQLSQEMKQVYEVANQEWLKIGNGTFAWYSDTGRAGGWGDYGLWNAPDYAPEPRTEVIIDANVKTAPWLANDPRGAAAFDNGLYDADLANTQVMRGTRLDDRLYGLAGNDSISGFAGKDRLVGGIGDDRITGGADTDMLVGGVGNDTFIFNRADISPGQADTITDFSALATGAGDSIRFIGLSAAQVAVAASGADAVVRYGNGTVNNSITLQEQGSNPLYVFGYADVAKEAAGNLANGFVLISDVMAPTTNQWSTITRAYDAAARLDTEATRYDTGAFRFVDLDNLGTQSWSRLQQDFNAAAQRSAFQYSYDDGRISHTTLDLTGAATYWSTLRQDFNAAGQRTAFQYTWDNGRISHTTEDRVGLSWKTLTQNFRAGDGARTDYNYIFDNGTKQVVRIDVDNTFTWTFETANYDAAGNLINIFYT